MARWQRWPFLLCETPLVRSQNFYLYRLLRAVAEPHIQVNHEVVFFRLSSEQSHALGFLKQRKTFLEVSLALLEADKVKVAARNRSLEVNEAA